MDNKKLTYTIQKKRMSAVEFVEVYKKSETKLEGFAWQNAAVLYASTHHESFKEEFKTMKEYAQAIGVSESTISRKIRAVDLRLRLCRDFGDAMQHLTLETVIEMLPLVKSDMVDDFVYSIMKDDYDIDTDFNRDAMRDEVKTYISKYTVPNEENVAEPEENTAEPEENTAEPEENTAEPEEDTLELKTPYIRVIIDGKTIPIRYEHENHILNTLRSLGYQL